MAISAFMPNRSALPSFIGSDSVTPPNFKAKDHKGKSMVSTSGVITFTTGLDNDFYQVDSNNRTVFFYIETRLAKLLNAPKTRTPLNISIVIDRSGSMQGIKMGYAKKAAKGIIDHLEPTDFVSIVMYDNSIDSVQEPIQPINKELIKSKIDKITPRGSTNLWGGTERGYEYVQKNYKPGFINRVLLISDGLANVGITDSIKIRQNVLKFKDENGITLSTFGVGLDYNETLMTDMAETGAGNYYFIDAPEKMVTILDQELNGMLNVIAKNAEINIKLPHGVSIQKSYPIRFRQNGDVVTFRLLDLFAEETKGTLITFRLDDHITTPLKFNTTLSYTDVMDDKMKSVTNANILTPNKSVDAYLTHFNKMVIEQTVLFTANENMEMAMQRADRGDYDGASSIIRENGQFMKSNVYYTRNSIELQKMDSTNSIYFDKLSKARKMNIDSVKKMQKTSREDNYQLRNKKQ
jgi:Ca-activated chloride channel family protein